MMLTFISCQGNKEESTQGNTPKSTSSGERSQLVTLTKAQKKEVGIETGKLKETEITSELSCNGKIEVSPNYIATIIPPVKGFIKELYYKEGDYVEKGTKLARLSHPEYLRIQENYLAVKSQAEYYEQEYKRQGELAVEKAASLKKMQKAKANYHETNARLQSLKELLGLLNIPLNKVENGSFSSNVYLHAPVSGYITDLYSNVGKIADENNPVYEIMNMNHIRLHLNIYEKDIAGVETGQKVTFTLAKNPQENYTTRINYIGNKINPEKQTFSVYSNLKSNSAFRHGLYVNAKVIQASEKSHVLPNEAIVRIEGVPHVFVAHPKGYAPQKVQTGKRNETYTLIKNFKELTDKKIVTKGAYFLNGVLSLE